ncbi:MAG: CsgG/HfaB family protein [Candidatus Cloacimonetes bacterium]|nr:CsgG/HfaB family protein [Candidatus Cloacimonadota bacterium]
MHKRVIILMILLMALFISACSQNGRYYRKAKKNYERGNVETAVIEACRSLRIKPDSKKAQDLLVQVWKQAIKNHDQNVADLEQNNDTYSYEQILQEHLNLKELASQVNNLPPLVNPDTGYRVMLNVPDLSKEIANSRENAAEAHYQAGVRYTKMSRTLDIQRKAAQEFKAAMSFIAEYKDSSLKYDQARKLAIRRIAIAPFTDKSNSRNRYGAISEIVADYIIAKIMSGGYVDEYTEVIARSQMDAVLAEQQLNASGLIDEASTVNLGQLLGAHEVLSGSILQVNASSPRIGSVDKTAKAKVVVGKESYVDDKGKTKERDVLGEVSCEYRIFTKSSSVTISGSFSVVDVETGKILLHESVESKTPWQDSWCRKIRGDERALNQSIRSMMDRTEPFAPEDGELVLTTLHKMGDIVVTKLGSFLK